jgi:hypothetical protein
VQDIFEKTPAVEIVIDDERPHDGLPVEVAGKFKKDNMLNKLFPTVQKAVLSSREWGYFAPSDF